MSRPSLSTINIGVIVILSMASFSLLIFSAGIGGIIIEAKAIALAPALGILLGPMSIPLIILGLYFFTCLVSDICHKIKNSSKLHEIKYIKDGEEKIKQVKIPYMISFDDLTDTIKTALQELKIGSQRDCQEGKRIKKISIIGNSLQIISGDKYLDIIREYMINPNNIQKISEMLNDKKYCNEEYTYEKDELTIPSKRDWPNYGEVDVHTTTVTGTRTNYKQILTDIDEENLRGIKYSRQKTPRTLLATKELKHKYAFRVSLDLPTSHDHGGKFSNHSRPAPYVIDAENFREIKDCRQKTPRTLIAGAWPSASNTPTTDKTIDDSYLNKYTKFDCKDSVNYIM